MFLINPYILGGGAVGNPLWNDLLAYYTADNTPNDSLGNYNGTLTNGATYGTGIINQGFSLDGVNDYVDVGSRTGFNNTQSFTFSAWINGTILNRTLVSNADTTSGGAALGTWNSGAGRKIALVKGTGVSQCFGNTTLSSSTWYHLVAVHTPYDGVSANVQFYVNGSADGSSIFDIGTPSGSNNQHIGASTNLAAFFSGIIDEVGIWSRDLSSSEVTELYNSGAGLQYT